MPNAHARISHQSRDVNYDNPHKTSIRPLSAGMPVFPTTRALGTEA